MVGRRCSAVRRGGFRRVRIISAGRGVLGKSEYGGGGWEGKMLCAGSSIVGCGSECRDVCWDG